MSKIKSLDDHSATILQLSVELSHLPPYHPDYDKKNDQLSRQLTAWVGKLSITIHRAENEQTGWESDEIGYPIIPMARKKDSGRPQTGDYIAYLDDYDMFAGVLVERKGVTRSNGRMTGCDLYSSFAKADNRRRFYAEIERYHQDPRFDLMVLIAECSYGEYLSFKPAFNGNQYNKCNYGMNVASRRATMAKLEVMGCHVKYKGTRQVAVEYYHDLVVQWCRWNYKKILNIDDNY